MTQDAKAKELRDKALAAIRGEKRIGPHFKPVHFDIDADGTATIEAEVDNVAVKRLALERLAATKGVGAIVDRLRVRPAEPMSDDGILDHLRKAYYDEPSFYELQLKGARRRQTQACARRLRDRSRGDRDGGRGRRHRPQRARTKPRLKTARRRARLVGAGRP